MAQTTHPLTGIACQAAISTDGSEWTDLSGTTISFEPSGGERETGSQHTMGDADPVVGIGPKASGGGTLTIVYTEESNEATDIIDGYYESGTRVYLRLRPQGDSVGKWQWKSRGYFTIPVIPSLDANSGDILSAGVGWHGTPWTQSAQVS